MEEEDRYGVGGEHGRAAANRQPGWMRLIEESGRGFGSADKKAADFLNSALPVFSLAELLPSAVASSDRLNVLGFFCRNV